MKIVPAYIPMTCMKGIQVRVPNDATEEDVKKKIAAGEFEATGDLEKMKDIVDDEHPIEVEMDEAEVVEDETPVAPDGFYLWVKRLGDCHLSKSGESTTVCGMPMLGNNYAKAGIDMKKCEECWKGQS